MKKTILSPELLYKMDAYWRAANYLSVGQIYLYDSPLLQELLKLSHVKPLIAGHLSTTPGQNFIYVHLNRIIKLGVVPFADAFSGFSNFAVVTVGCMMIISNAISNSGN